MTPSHSTSMVPMEAKPSSMEPGKMIVRDRAAGITVIGMTMWQKGVWPWSISARLIDMLPRISSRLGMKVSTKATAYVTKSTERYLCVRPV